MDRFRCYKIYPIRMWEGKNKNNVRNNIQVYQIVFKLELFKLPSLGLASPKLCSGQPKWPYRKFLAEIFLKTI